MTGALEKLREEVGELVSEHARAGDPVPETEPDAAVEHEVGDALFSLVNVSRRLNVDPELALRAATRRFVQRVETAAELAAAEGVDWRSLDLAAQDTYYDRAKETLR